MIELNFVAAGDIIIQKNIRMSIEELFAMLCRSFSLQDPSCIVALFGCARIFDVENKTIAHEVCILRYIEAVDDFNTTLVYNIFVLVFRTFEKPYVVFVLNHFCQVHCHLSGGKIVCVISLIKKIYN